jgi:hypothetical protein
MKKTVVVFGLLSGAVSSLLMLLSMPLLDRIGFDNGVILGYTGMVMAFLLVYFGVRSYRDNVAGGTVGFGRAFTVGLLITLVSCACYVATWEVIYFKLWPGFADKYTAYAMDKAKASGASQQKLDETARQMVEMKKMLDRPLVNAAVTFIEPLPVGLLVTLISAGVLKKKRPA